MKSLIFSLTLAVSLGHIVPATAQEHGSASRYDADTKEKIHEVENGLSQLVRVEGEKLWTIEERMKHYKVPALSLAIVDNYEIKWAKAYGVIEKGKNRAATTETAFQSASISKSINGLAVMHLVEKGKTDLESDINDSLKSWKFPYDESLGNYKITLANLLSHTAGTTTSGFEGYQTDENLPSLIQILDGESPANSGAVRSFRLPNEGYRYSGGGTVISQVLLQDVTGKPFESIIQESVLDPIGMTDSFYSVANVDRSGLAMSHDFNGNPRANGFNYYPELAPAALWSTPTDLSRFIIEVQKSLAGKSSIISRPTAELMLTPVRSDSPSALGFFIDDFDGVKYFQHGGSNEGFKCQYFGSFEGGKGAVVMVNSDSYDIITEVMRSIAAAYDWPNFHDATPRKIVKLEEDHLESLTGVYKFDDGPRLSITREESQLFLGTSFGNRFEIYPESGDSFFLRVADEQVKFKDEAGIKSFDFYQNGNITNAVKQRPSLAYAMFRKIEGSDVAQALGWLEENRENENYSMDVFDLNEVGYLLFKKSRVSDAIAVFRFAMKEFPESTKADNRLLEDNVNMTGYDYLREQKVNEAIEIFRLNVELYPASSNVYDSLGEGLLASGQYEESLKHYQKSVELDPSNAGGKEAIRKIRQKLGKE